MVDLSVNLQQEALLCLQQEEGSSCIGAAKATSPLPIPIFGQMHGIKYPVNAPNRRIRLKIFMNTPLIK